MKAFITIFSLYLVNEPQEITHFNLIKVQKVYKHLWNKNDKMFYSCYNAVKLKILYKVLAAFVN